MEELGLADKLSRKWNLPWVVVLLLGVFVSCAVKFTGGCSEKTGEFLAGFVHDKYVKPASASPSVSLAPAPTAAAAAVSSAKREDLLVSVERPRTRDDARPVRDLQDLVLAALGKAGRRAAPSETATGAERYVRGTGTIAAVEASADRMTWAKVQLRLEWRDAPDSGVRTTQHEAQGTGPDEASAVDEAFRKAGRLAIAALMAPK